MAQGSLIDGVRWGAGSRGRIAVAVEPTGLGVDAREPDPVAATPGAADLAGLAAEVGDHLTASMAGHTLPRPMGRVCLLALAIVLPARHQAMSLALFCR